jgi:hypothetical protein
MPNDARPPSEIEAVGEEDGRDDLALSSPERAKSAREGE